MKVLLFFRMDITTIREQTREMNILNIAGKKAAWRRKKKYCLMWMQWLRDKNIIMQQDLQ